MLLLPADKIAKKDINNLNTRSMLVYVGLIKASTCNMIGSGYALSLQLWG